MRNTNQSANDSYFLKQLEAWFNDRPEILVLFRYPYAAGNREFEFFSSFEQLQRRIRGLRQRTSIIAFRQPLLPLRGVVDDGFIAKCLETIPDTKDYLVVETVLRSAGKYSWFHDDEGLSHAQLREALEESRDTPVAAGICPNYINDSEDVISAIVPDDDGTVRPAAY